MTVIEKALVATLKDIGNVLNVLGIGSAPGLQREYSTAKSNYFYSKAGKDVKEWLTEIDRILKTNNMTNERKVAVVAAHLRDVTADWFKVDKTNINQYIDNNARSFI